MNNIIDIKPLLFGVQKPKVVITTHHKPDADALGSSLGLWHYLKLKGLDPVVVAPTDYGSFLTWMPGEKEVINYEADTDKSIRLVSDADFIFCLDFNALKRINSMGELVKASKATKVMIDHHLDPDDFATFYLHDTNASSTCELIYDAIKIWGDEALVSKDIASCLYAGIMTDTASFKHRSTYPSTHLVAAALLEKGAESNVIFENIYDNYSIDRMRFIGYCLNEKLVILPEYNTALMFITTEELKKYNSITGDTEGLVNYGLAIKGINFSILVVDRSVARKMSFRSKGEFPANEFARKYFNGGGHFNAAGGESTDPMEVVEQKINEGLKEYKHLLG
ncbi:MAG: DHH family phosphoesterase [Bacteroidota bacterium]